MAMVPEMTWQARGPGCLCLGNKAKSTAKQSGYVPVSSKIDIIAAFGLATGVVFDLSDAVSMNIGWGWAKPDKSDVTDYTTAYQG